MGDQLFTTNEPHAEEIAELVEIGMLVPVEVDVENPVAYLHATIWSFRKNYWTGVTGRRMPTRDEVRHWVERIIELSIGDTDE